MFNTNAAPSLSDIAAVTGNRNGDGMWDNGAWWIIILLIFGYGGFGGYGYGNGGAMQGYATQADIQRGFDNSAVIGKLDRLGDAFANLAYDQLGQMNGINTNIMQTGNAVQQAVNAGTVAGMQNTNALQAQIAQGFCDNRYEALQSATTTNNLISQMGYQNATDTCAITNAIANQTQQIMQNDNANYRALHEELVQSQMDAKDAKIAEQASVISNLALKQELVNDLKPTPVPAFSAANLYGGLYGIGNACTACNGTIGF